MTTSVFVSGASGYIAQHIIKLLLSKGYEVVGSVRTNEKGEHLKSLFSSNKFSYEVVSSLESEASPVTFVVDDVEKDLLIPAREGTLNVLRAIKAYGPQIKHVVVTSSVAAQIHPSDLHDSSIVISENSWSSIEWDEAKTNAFFGYFGSKKFAEKAAWDFLKAEKPQYTLYTVNPGFVFGPQAFDSEVSPQLNFSSEVVAGLLKLGPDAKIPDTAGSFIDVRDVAKAHLAAFEQGWGNKRLYLSNEDFSSQSILDIINDSFPQYRGDLPVGDPGSVTPVAKVDNVIARQALGFSFIDLKTAVVDTVSQIVAASQT